MDGKQAKEKPVHINLGINRKVYEVLKRKAAKECRSVLATLRHLINQYVSEE